MARFKVLRGGMLTTVQDLGRWGHQSSGVPVAGPMDAFSHRLANRIVGNHEGAAALEITLVGPELEAAGDVLCAACGAEFELRVDGRTVSFGRTFEVKHGATLRFGRRLAGARAALAVRGGFDLPLVLGSRATSLVGRMGPFGGRALVAGDVLPIARPAAPVERLAVGQMLALPQGGARLRAIPGPHDEFFDSSAIDMLFGGTFTISTSSNRMGYRLDGPVLSKSGTEILSDATPLGSVQVPASGQPILLMADRQTTGGYPRIATVITADGPVAGQLAPGDWVRFAPCTRPEAIDALLRLERRLAGPG